MRISKIHLERFLGIRRLTLALNDGLQLIAGPNNSCKSTLLKAINYFFSGLDDVDQREFAPQNEYYEQEGSRSLTKIRLHFSDLNEEEVKAFRKSWLPKSKEFWVEVRVSRSGEITYATSNSGVGLKVYQDIVDMYDVVYVPAVRAGTSDVRENETRKLFVATKSVLAKRRRGSLNKLQKDFSTAVESVTEILGRLLEESKQAIVDSLPPETAISFQFPSSDQILDLILSETTIGTRLNTSLTIDNEGTGFQSLLSLGLLRYVESVNRNRNQLFLVEEPEAFLHPQYQRSVADYILRLSERSQAIVTTHSAVIVDSVEIRHVARLFRQPDGLDYTWEWKSDQIRDAEYLSRYCDAKNSEIIFADKVILCEGITDSNVIFLLLQDLLRTSHHHLNISVISGDGSALTHVAKLLDWFDIESLIILDKDAYAGPNRDVLKTLCKDKGQELVAQDYVILDKQKAMVCTHLGGAALVRDAVNNVLAPRNIFVFGSDIEGAVVHSFSKAKLLEHLGPDGLGYFSKESHAQIDGLGGQAARDRIEELVGSKGWNTKKRNKDNKPKPHILSNLIGLAGCASFREQSDLVALRTAISQFLEL